MKLVIANGKKILKMTKNEWEKLGNDKGWIEAEVKKDVKEEKKDVDVEAKKKKKWDPNPWAVCHTTVDKDKNPEKYERCVMDVKEKQK